MATVSIKRASDEPITLKLKIIEPPDETKKILKEVAETNLLIKQMKEELKRFLGGIL